MRVILSVRLCSRSAPVSRSTVPFRQFKFRGPRSKSAIGVIRFRFAISTMACSPERLLECLACDLATGPVKFSGKYSWRANSVTLSKTCSVRSCVQWEPFHISHRFFSATNNISSPNTSRNRSAFARSLYKHSSGNCSTSPYPDLISCFRLSAISAAISAIS